MEEKPAKKPRVMFRQPVLPEPFVEVVDDDEGSEDEDTADEADNPVIGFSLDKLLGCQLQELASTSMTGQV